jgi:hypothetical protein
MTSVEMTEERPPLQWWPTESDLTAIRAIPFNEALVLARRWPSTAMLGAGADPIVVTGGSGASPSDVDTGSAMFTTPPGQAP